MAIFEKKFERKTTLDDTQSLSCVIETAQKVDGHTVSTILTFQSNQRCKKKLIMYSWGTNS